MHLTRIRRIAPLCTLAGIMALGVAGCGGGSGTGQDAGATSDAAPSCSGSQTSCSGTCADLQSDTANCGACGTACAAGEACMGGSCMVVCPSGTTACGNACYATANDPAHCGSCDNACADGEFCVSGACQAACPLTVCGDACVDTQVTATHCGTCDTACNAGEACVDGACQLSCTADQVVCDGACATPMTDRNHCGATADCTGANAGATCADGEVCVEGACTTSCGTGLLACDGTCTNPMTDRNHCGATADCSGANTGATCADGEVCVEGACTTSCGTGLLACDGTCTNPMTDRNHCGATADCSGANTGATCAAGELCVDGACTLSCPAGEIACGGACVDPMSDRAYCGASGDCAGANAGAACADGEVCAAGTCDASCGSTLSLCGGACVDTNSDPMHCGNCTTTCPSGAHELSACDAGTCRAVCEAGFGDCDGNATNGCETSLGDDASNCGVCGHVCAGGAMCTSGVCGGFGHAVLMGHDFYERTADIDSLLGNAVFLSSVPGTLNVLEYTEYSDNSSTGEAANARAAIMDHATTLGRTISLTTAATSADVLTDLPSADVFVVYEQENAPGDLTSQGMSWATALQNFVARGGVVVVMDHDYGNGGTWRLLSPSGLIVVTGVTSDTGSTETVDATADPLAAGVTATYSAPNGTLSFSGVAPADVVTVTSTTNGPVVMHRQF